jgi:HEAT repeat protein
VARATKLDCLTTLAFRDPGSPHFQEAVAALQRELKSSELPMRVRALIELRRLGPQRRLDSGVLVRTDENVTANGGVCVPDDAIADLIEAGRRVPDLRSELLQNLDQVLAPDVRDFAVESLRDPQRSVRRQAVDLLGEFPPSVERRRAAEDALNDEDDPAIRSLLRKLR